MRHFILLVLLLFATANGKAQSQEKNVFNNNTNNSNNNSGNSTIIIVQDSMHKESMEEIQVVPSKKAKLRESKTESLKASDQLEESITQIQNINYTEEVQIAWNQQP
jgi:ribosomal 50S subunit-associated protein YjgA (DUF615 family)